MNPTTNKFEQLVYEKMCKEMGMEPVSGLLLPDGTPVPKTWSIFREGENVIVKDYTFKVVRIGESYLVLEPVGPIEIGKSNVKDTP